MSERKRILVVDDEPVIRLFLQELFEDEGYEVVTGQTIAEGLAQLRSGSVNLVVTDKNLPDGTGFEIVHAAQALDPPCEAMIITGYASLDSAVMALQIGAYDYVLKPIEDVDLLLEKARKATAKQDIARELSELRRLRDRGCASCKTSASTVPGSADLADDGASRSPTGAKIASGALAGLSADHPQILKLAELGSLIPMLAHELRQPLAGVKGYVDLLLHKPSLDDALRSKLVCMGQQLSHMAGLVESLTTYARVSTGNTLVDLRSPLDRALSIFPALRVASRYELVVDASESLPPIKGNPNAIQQVLVNLIKNAKDALDENGGGRLRVTVRHDEAAAAVLVRVEDTGPGIQPEAREHIFQPFFTTKQEGVGTGLGLTICKQILADHGGTIHVESPLTAEGGTAFEIALPCVRDAALAAI